MRKYSIAVCDDKPDQLELILQETTAICNDNNIEFSIQGFLDAQELLAATKTIPNAFDLILLDVLLPETDGVKIAQKLRKNGTSSTIIFITTSADFAVKGYEVGVYRYLLKPIDRDVLAAAILSDYAKNSIQNEVVFHIGAETRRVPVQDIYTITTRGRGVLVRTLHDMFEVPQKISEIENMLPAGTLVRCHRSCIVNIAHIDHIQRYEATIRISNKVPVSKAYYAKVKEKMMDHLSD